MIALGLAVFGLQFFVAMALQLATLRVGAKPKLSHSIPKISVLIPFHNEERRIQPLITSLNLAKPNRQFEFIFIDDHSTDGTVDLLLKKLKIPHQCITNPYEKGKKNAIKFGVSVAKDEHIVTWDADISFGKNYLPALALLQFSDLVILPVNMRSRRLIGKLAIVEFAFMKSLAFGSAGLGKPVLCYGANLAFKKQAFLDVDHLRNDYAIPSGDDLFLLQAMEKGGKSVRANVHPDLAVKTKAPRTLRILLQQRQRWFGKMNTLFTPSTKLALGLLILVQVMFLTVLIASIFNPYLLLTLLLKFAAECVASWSFISQKGYYFFVLILHQFWYPFFIVRLFFKTDPENRWNTVLRIE